jgi:hypothetical protein
MPHRLISYLVLRKLRSGAEAGLKLKLGLKKQKTNLAAAPTPET